MIIKYNIFVVAMTVLVACSTRKQEATSTTQETVETSTVKLTDVQLKNSGVRIGLVEKKDIAPVIKVSGKVDVPPQNMVSVGFPLGGNLQHTKLLPGMHVSKGEVIAIMQDQQFIQLQQDYLTAKARHPFLEAEYMRQRELNQSKAASDKVYQQAEAECKTNRILINSLSEKLQLIGVAPQKLHENNISRYVKIYAPISGYVSKVNVNIGRYVNPSEVLFELVNPADIHLVLTVFEKDIARLKIGQQLVAYTNNSDRQYPCEIILIGKDIVPDRSTEVHCHFLRYDKDLIPGMYMNAEIILNAEQTTVVPEAAIVRYENQQFIFVAKGTNEFEMKRVELRGESEGWVSIGPLPGLDLSVQKIVTHNAYVLLMALKNKAD